MISDRIKDMLEEVEKNKGKPDKKALRKIQKKMNIASTRNTYINALDVVVGAFNDIKTYILYLTHPVANESVIRRYLRNLDDEQIENNIKHLEQYTRISFENDKDEVLTPLCAYKFFHGGYSTNCITLYEKFQSKDVDKLVERLKTEREKAIQRIKKNNNKNIMYGIAETENFYIQQEHRLIMSDMNVLYEVINDNITVAYSLIKNKNDRTYLKKVYNSLSSFLKIEMTEYLIETHKHYKKQFTNSKLNKKQLRKSKKKTSTKTKQDYFILGKKVSKRKFEKELQFYLDNEDYVVTKFNIKEVS